MNGPFRMDNICAFKCCGNLIDSIWYGGDHKIKHFAYHRDFLVHEIACIKHTQNASYLGIKHFQWHILFSTNDWLWNILYPGEAFCVCFIRGIWCIKKSLWQAKCFILWYPPYLSPPEIDTWKNQNLLNQRKNQPIRCFHKKIRTRSLAILHDIWGSSRI